MTVILECFATLEALNVILECFVSLCITDRYIKVYCKRVVVLLEIFPFLIM